MPVTLTVNGKRLDLRIEPRVTLLNAIRNRADLDFTDEYQVTKNYYRFGKAPGGTPGNVFGIGPAVFTLPSGIRTTPCTAPERRASRASKTVTWLSSPIRAR